MSQLGKLSINGKLITSEVCAILKYEAESPGTVGVQLLAALDPERIRLIQLSMRPHKIEIKDYDVGNLHIGRLFFEGVLLEAVKVESSDVETYEIPEDSPQDIFRLTFTTPPPKARRVRPRRSRPG